MKRSRRDERKHGRTVCEKDFNEPDYTVVSHPELDIYVE